MNMGGELKFRARDLETYGGNTQEWGEAQLRYVGIKGDLERRLCLRIWFVGLRGEILGRIGKVNKEKIREYG